ncbi:ABC transporter ATP-binding protein [Microaerobacter geothermalis]|uniref:ABC transporter ATP-binding protein n=1 Tax=Microaerobacter geothermalis TaxID=674972 RepID=UPI001F1E4B46|nr:ABC transporter ATP-binding protein [Microaerobacter geothermalis]MCF6092580.1 ABC transporter ATP-binding protein [Microaerobacter geothermalis]
MLVVKNLSVDYGSASVLRNVQMEVNDGEIVALIGRNGAGKTTVLRTITGLVKAKDGEVNFQDQELTNIPAHQIVKLGISHVPQGRQVFGDQTVEDNLILGAYTNRKNKKRMMELVEREYERFPRLKERRRQMAGTLSGGEQQMLAIARGLMSEPKLLVLDEPSMGLSPLYVKHIFDTLLQLKKEGVTILVVEQLATAALSISDRAYVLQLGEVKLNGKSRDLLKDDRILKTYLGAS